MTAVSPALPRSIPGRGTVEIRAIGQPPLFGVFHTARVCTRDRAATLRLAGSGTFTTPALAQGRWSAATDADPLIAQLANRVAAPVELTASSTGPVDGLDVHAIVSSEGNRWNGPGEPTIYLAAHASVAMAELGRHLGSSPSQTAIWELRVSLCAVVDLRGAPIVRGQSGPDSTWILDRTRSRALARAFRERGDCDGLVVPSAAFLDDPDRWNLVVFVERLQRPLEEVLVPVRSLGVWRALAG
jgi:RES domain-containing protein